MPAKKNSARNNRRTSGRLHSEISRLFQLKLPHLTASYAKRRRYIRGKDRTTPTLGQENALSSWAITKEGT